MVHARFHNDMYVCTYTLYFQPPPASLIKARNLHIKSIILLDILFYLNGKSEWYMMLMNFKKLKTEYRKCPEASVGFGN